MATVSIELDEDQSRRLRELSATVRRSEQELCREAVQRYLEGHERPDGEDANAGHEALRAMIGLVKQEPSDLSIQHDLRPGDPT
jgi:predicted transcriptional regulator